MCMFMDAQFQEIVHKIYVNGVSQAIWSKRCLIKIFIQNFTCLMFNTSL